MPGKLMLTFDDGTIDHYDASVFMDSYKLKGTFGIVTNFLGKPGYLDEKKIDLMRSSGHSICNHSAQHLRLGEDKERPYLEAYSPQAITEDALIARDCLNTKGFDGDYYIAPFGTLNVSGTTHLIELLSYFKWIRLSKGIPTLNNLWSYDYLSSSYRDAYHSVEKKNKLVVGVTEPADVRRQDGVKAIAIQSILTNTLVVICYHLINHVVGEDQKVTWDRFCNDIAFIAELVQSRGLEVVTPKEMLSE